MAESHRGASKEQGLRPRKQVEGRAMSLVERKMAEMAIHRAGESEAHQKSAAVSVPMRYVKDWSLVADARSGGRVELVLDEVPVGSLLVLLNELKPAS